MRLVGNAYAVEVRVRRSRFSDSDGGSCIALSSGTTWVDAMSLEDLNSAIQKLVDSANDGDPVWRRQPLLVAGLPFRNRRGNIPFRGINVLLLWQAQAAIPGAPTGLVWGKPSYGRPPLGPWVSLVAYKPDAVIRAIHEVSALQAHDAPAPTLEGVAAALRQMGHAVPANPSGDLLAKVLSAVVTARLASEPSGARSAQHVWLRKSLTVALAEALIAELACAFVLARLQLAAAPLPKAKTLELNRKRLVLAAHVAWDFADRLWVELAADPTILWAAAIEDPVSSPGGSPNLSQLPPTEPPGSSAPPTLISLLGELKETPKVTGEFIKNVIAWAETNPEQARAAFSIGPYREAGTPADASAGLARLAARSKVVRESAGVGGQQAAARALGRQLCAALRVLDDEAAVGPIDAAGDRAAGAWAKLRKKHLRTTWLQHIHRLTPEDLLGTGLPFEPDALPKDGRALSLQSVGGAMGRRQRTTVNEASFCELLMALVPEGRVEARARPGGVRRGPLRGRQLNRLLRRSLSFETLPTGLWTGLQEPPKQQSLFGDGPKRHPDWGQLIRALAPDEAYRLATIPKRSGGRRSLHVPSGPLAKAQRRIAQVLSAYFAGTAAIAAFQPHRSVAWHAIMHAGARTAVCMDIADFFGSVHPRHAQCWIGGSVFECAERRVGRHPFQDWSEEGKQTLLGIVFYTPPEKSQPELAQGAPSSPVVANLAAASMDSWIRHAMERHFPGVDICYSRYADDLVISTRATVPGFAETVERLVAGGMIRSGFLPNRAKTRVWSAGDHPLVLCGVRVPAAPTDPPTLPRETARRVRAALNNVSRAGPHGNFEAADTGLLAFAYGVTGDPAMIAFQSGGVRELADAVTGPIYARDFLVGWASA